MKLAIGLPISDEKIHTQFFLSFLLLDKPEHLTVVYPRTQFHAADLGKIRTHLCDQAMSLDCTHILMMDTDQVYHDSDLILRLMSHGKDIVGGKVHRRYPPFEPILNINNRHASDIDIENGGLIEVDATGTGCLLINLSVLKDIPYPWFEMTMGENGPVGEDIGFCRKAKKAGHKIYVDCDVNIGHLATMQVNEVIYNLWKKIHKVKEL